ncbi:MAG: patatin family protein [Akkermansia sp.]|nr:patatin family protein [Akkermansia sp.]
MKKGLVLEGGAMRGMFTAGVMDVLMEQGVVFDGAIGVSAGAAFGVNYKSGQIGRAIRYNERFCNDKRYCGLWSLLKSGDIYNTDFCYRVVPTQYDPFDFDAYGKNPMEFYVVCTDIETGKPVYHTYGGWEDHGFDWIRASASMPLVSHIVEIDGQKMLDGGISDPIPLRQFESLGYKRNVLILTQPREYRKKKSSAMLFIKLMYRKYPHLVEAMAQRHEVYNNTLAYIEAQEAAGNVLVIRPEAPLPVSRVEKNPANLRAAYNIGRDTATERLAEIRRYLDELGISKNSPKMAICRGSEPQASGIL